MLPFDIETLVAPRHLDVTRLQVRAVLAHLRDVQREAAAHCFGDGLLDRRLRLARPGPVALQHPVPMLDLNERAARFVTGAPERREFLPRLDRPIGRGQQMRNLDGELRLAWLEHLNRQSRRNFFSKTVLRFEHRAINAGAKGDWDGGFTFRVRRETLYRDRVGE